MREREEVMSEHQEINDVAPSSLKHLIGQRGVVAQVEVALDAAQQDAKKFDSALLVGGPGLGKSALARIIADEMATGFHKVIGQSIKFSSDVNALLLGAKNRDVVHIDECHELPKTLQTAPLPGARSAEAVRARPEGKTAGDTDCRLHTAALDHRRVPAFSPRLFSV